MSIFEPLVRTADNDEVSPAPAFVAEISTRYGIVVDDEYSDQMFPPLFEAVHGLVDAQNEYEGFTGRQHELSGRKMAAAASQVAAAAAEVAMRTDALARLLVSLRGETSVAGIDLQAFADGVATALYNVAVAAQSAAG